MAQAGKRPAQQARSRLTQRKILAAARDALAAAGWDGMTVARVAAAAGVSVGSVYERFTDKDGLVHAVQHDVLDEVDTDLRVAYALLAGRDDLTAAQLIAEAVRALAHQMARHGAVLGLLVLRAAADPSLRARGNATSELAEELFTTLLLARAGELGCPEPHTAVPMAFRAVFSTAMWQVMFGQDAGLRHDIPPDAEQRELATLCQSYLLRFPAPSAEGTREDQ
ncbi:TetR family transcriptional regulator [Streptomyces sp. SID5914]|nr:TetR family transcriptional regulator [Streptomyces sp. SID5914]MZG13735.1 TetR family transcriptional regulator [Streptomyces sp. SID5914]